MAYNKETGMWEGFIYCIENLVNGKKYIGQTIMTIRKRWYQHNKCAKSDDPSTALGRAMKKYGIENFKIYELLRAEGGSKDEMREELNYLEQFMIEIHGTLIKYGKGYNIQSGGQKGRIKYSPVVAYDMDRNIVNTFDNCASAAAYFNVSEASVYRICAGEQGNHEGVVFRKKDDPFDKYPIESINQSEMLFKPIDAYKVNTLEYVGTYQSLKHCAKELGVNSSDISPICKGKRISSGGYIFRYKGDPVNKYQTVRTSHNRRRVNKYNDNHQYIGTYNSVTKASEDIHINRNFLSDRYLKTHEICNGFFLYYSDDPNQPDKTKIIA